MASRMRALSKLCRGLSVLGNAGQYMSPLLSGQALIPAGLGAEACQSSSWQHSQAAKASTSISYPPAEAEVGKPAPQFTCPAVVDGELGSVSLSDYKGKWTILFFYPKDFTQVCPTEIIAFSDRAPDFEKINCQLIAGSTDTEESHLAWMQTPRKKGGLGHIQIPVIADTTKEVAARYGILLKDIGIALRGLFIINPEGVLEHITVNNLGIGRSVDEALRVLQAIQFVAEHGEVCPADWKPGEQSINSDSPNDYFSTAKASQDQDDTNLKVIHDKREYEQLVGQSGKVVVDFMASWCGKCKQIKPLVEKLQREHEGDITFAQFDTSEEKLEGLAADLGIKTLPAFRFYRDGKQVDSIKQVVGYKRKPLEDAVQQLSSA